MFHHVLTKQVSTNDTIFFLFYYIPIPLKSFNIFLY